MKIRRWFSLLLALLLFVSAVPLPAGALARPAKPLDVQGFPWPAEEAAEPEGEAEAELQGLINPDPMWFQCVNLSGAGASQMDAWASGEYVSLFDHEGGQMDAENLKARVMVRAMHFNAWDEDSPIEYFFYKNTGPSVHELTLYGGYDLAPEEIEITGVTLQTPLEKHVFGDEGGELYWYTAQVQVPAQDSRMNIRVRGTDYADIPLTHVEGTACKPLFSTFEVYDYVENGVDPDRVDSVTVRFSGFSLPDDAQSYNLTWNKWDEETGLTRYFFVPGASLSDADALGYRCLTFPFRKVYWVEQDENVLHTETCPNGVLGAEDLMWCDLSIGKVNLNNPGFLGSDYGEVFFGEHPAFFFRRGNHLSLEGNRYVFPAQYDFFGGDFVSMPVPYYCLYKELPPGPEVKPSYDDANYIALYESSVTHDGKMTVTVHPGSYTGGQVRVTVYGNPVADWTAATEGKTLRFTLCNWDGEPVGAEDYGDYSFRVSFRKEGLRNYGLNGYVEYFSGVPAAMESGRVLDAATGQEADRSAGGAYILRGAEDKRYTIEVDRPSGYQPDLYYPDRQNILCDFYDETGVILSRSMETFDVDDQCWRLSLPRSAMLEAVGVRIYNDGTAPGMTAPGGALDLKLANAQPLVLRTLQAPTVDNALRQETGDDETPVRYHAVRVGALLTAAFEASDSASWQREATLRYEDLDGTTQSLSLSEERLGKRSYRVSCRIPEDAVALEELRYTLRDSETGEGDELVFDLSDYRVAADTHISGFTTALVGTTFRFCTDNSPRPTIEKTVTITEDMVKNGLDIPEWPKEYYQDSTLYAWELSGRSGHIVGGHAAAHNVASYILKRGQTLDLSAALRDLKLGSLTVETGGFASDLNGETVNPPAQVTLSLRTPDLETHSAVGVSGTAMQDIPLNTNVTVSLSYEDELGEISACTPDGAGGSPFQLQGDTTLHYTYHPFSYRTISGVLWGKREVQSGPLAGHQYAVVPWDTAVIVTQEISRGGKTETVTQTWNPRPNPSGKVRDIGHYSFRCYDNIPVQVEIRSMNWKTVTRTVTAPGDQVLEDVELEQGGEQIIVVSAQATTPRSIREDGSLVDAASDSQTTSVDAGFLNVYAISDGNKQYGADSGAFETYYADGKIVVKVRDGIAADGKTIWTYADGRTEVGGVTLGLHWRNAAQSVKWNASGSMTTSYTLSYQGGELRGTVVDATDPDMTGFLILQSRYGNALFTSGKGELHLGYAESETGASHKVLALMVRDEYAGEMAEILQQQFDQVLAQAATWENSRSRAIVFRDVTLYNASYMYLDPLRPVTPVKGELLRPWEFDYYYTAAVNTLEEDNDIVQMVGRLTKRFPETPDADWLKVVKLYTLKDGVKLSVPFTVNGEDAGLGADYHWDVNHYTHPKNYRPTELTIVADLPMDRYQNAVRFELEVFHNNGTNPNQGSPGNTVSQSFRLNDTVPMFQLSVPTTVSLMDEMAALSLNTAPPEKQALWTLKVGVRAFVSEDEKENAVTIWDNGVAVDTFSIPAYANRSSQVISRQLRLTDNLNPGVHVLWATRTYRGQTMCTQPQAFNLIQDSIDQVYISDLSWVHYNHRYSWDPNEPERHYFRNLSDMAGETFWVWPGKRSDMSLTLHNAYGSEVKGVSIRLHRAARPAPPISGVWNYGVPESFFSGIPAYDDVLQFTHVGDNTAAHCSYWALENVNLGMFEWFSFEVDMGYNYWPVSGDDNYLRHEEQKRQQELLVSYRANGLGPVPDDTEMVEALATLTKDQLQETLNEKSVYLPDALMGLDFQVTKNTGSDYEVRLKTATAEVKDYRLTVHEGDEIAVDDVWDLMEYERANGSQNPDEPGWAVFWAELDGMQGSTLIRMAVNNQKDKNGNYALTMHKTAYITASVAEAIEQGTTLPSAGEQASLMGNYDAGDPPDHWTKKTYDVTTYIYSPTDITQDLYVNAVKGTYTDAKAAEAAGRDAKFIPKQVGDVMNVLGVIDAGISIRKGPSGKDTDGLYYLLNNVKDQKFRAAIEQQLRDYDQLRMDIYAQDTAMSAVGAGANFVPDPTPLTKIVCFLGSLGNGVISGWAKDYNRQVYNTTFLDIQRQIKLEQYKALRKQADEDFKNMIRRRFGKDVADNERRLREEKKYWYLSIDEFGDYKWKLRQNCPEFNTYQDPSGYVYEAVPDQRLEGVTATLYYSPTRDGSYSVWADPNKHVEQRQDNPVSTTEEGRYQWMVPSGWWKVCYEKNGYRTAWSKPMNVPPIHTAVDVGLLSTEAPKARISIQPDGSVQVLFTKYMQLESLIRLFGDGSGYDAEAFDGSAFAVRFYDASGDPVRGTVRFPDLTPNRFYVDGVYTQDVIASDYFVRTAVFTPEEGAEAVKTYDFGEGIVSYSGVALNTAKQAKLYLITLDPKGGSLSRESTVTDESGHPCALPSPAREGYSFQGWYTSDGKELTLESVVKKDCTATARWTLTEPYAITVSQVPADESAASVSFTFENRSKETAALCVVAAYSLDGRMLDMQTQKLSKTQASLTVTYNYSSQPDAVRVKAFLCKENNWTPLCEAAYCRVPRGEAG